MTPDCIVSLICYICYFFYVLLGFCKCSCAVVHIHPSQYPSHLDSTNSTLKKNKVNDIRGLQNLAKSLSAQGSVSWSSGGAWARIMEGLMAWGGGGGKQNHYRLIFGEKIGLKLRYIHIFSCELGGPPPRLAPMKLRH
uniref:Uncharacterized protein n=1 Tax=Aegilops tauschii subsp. strangulata TaxID=200361 RepID=A0A453HPL0_AEGTS